jgi:hypothetical protein
MGLVGTSQVLLPKRANILWFVGILNLTAMTLDAGSIDDLAWMPAQVRHDKAVMRQSLKTQDYF